MFPTESTRKKLTALIVVAILIMVLVLMFVAPSFLAGVAVGAAIAVTLLYTSNAKDKHEHRSGANE